MKVNHKLIAVLACFTFVVVFAAPSHAQLLDPQKRSWSAGIGSIATAVDETGHDDLDGYSLIGSYQQGLNVLENVKGQAYAEGTFKYCACETEDGTGTTFDGTIYDLAGYGGYKYPLGTSKTYALGKLGLVYESNNTDAINVDGGSGLGVGYGLGAGYNLSPDASVEVQYTAHGAPDIDTSFGFGGEIDTGSTSDLELRYVKKF